MFKSHFSLTSNLSIVLILILITFITYMNILPNQLFYDDEELIYKNTYVQNLRFSPRFFTENMIAGAGKTSNMYRPVLLTSFAIDYLIWGGSPAGFHLTSIFLHAANSVLIFFLITKLFGKRLLAALTSILFTIHPVQTEAITYASGRTDPLFTFFCLISLLFFLSSLTIRKDRLGKYLLSLFFFILALLSKEAAMILPFLVGLIYLVTYHKDKLNRTQLIKIFSPFIFIDILYLVLRLSILNFGNILNFYQTANSYSQNISIRIFTFTKVFFEYIGILLFPKDLIFARDIQFVTSFINPWVILFFLFVGILLLISIIFWKENKLFLFGFFWFFITLAPVSGIIPINNIIAEHYLYLPSLAFFLICAYFFIYLWNKFPNPSQQIFLMIILVFIFIALSTRTIIRNLDWRDPITFYTKSLSQSPWNVSMRHNLAMTYADKGEIDRAIKEYKTLISLADVYPNTHHNLADAYKVKGQYKEAEEEYMKALKIDPNFYFSYYGLIDLYQKTGEKEKLEEIMKKIQKLKLR